MVTTGDAAVKERMDSERNQGRAPDMGWLDHDRLGFNYRLSDVASRHRRSRSSTGSTTCSRRAHASRTATARRSPASRGSRCRARTPAGTGAAGSSSSSSSRPTARPATTSSCALRERGIQSKPYLPAIHLMSLYRERFGHREGEFPVCEDVAARSIALPFFPEMTDGQVDARGRGAAGSPRARLDSRGMSRFAEPQDPDFASINRSLDVDRRLWPYDVAQSRAHARMLAAQGIIERRRP